MSYHDFSPFKPDPCCRWQRVANTDFTRWNGDQGQRIVNRCCLHCYTHWYGPEGEVRKFSSKNWDAWISGSLCEDKPGDDAELRRERALLREMRNATTRKL